MKRRLARWVARHDRGPVMHRLILAVLPRAIARRFDAASAEDLEATLELAIRHESRPASYALSIAGASCSVRSGAPSSASARATIGADDLILLAGGAVTWPQLLSSGRFELTGDPFLALRFASLFRLPVVLEGAEAASSGAS
ncbi:MAG TPA: SCP2 sterol-binding domain-containing protein [Solirubrobacteraceae bacterium]|nr:SCP2 sterol-binding domain-containing protein [Solirubrobacteraceae bacterium]